MKQVFLYSLRACACACVGAIFSLKAAVWLFPSFHPFLLPLPPIATTVSYGEVEGKTSSSHSLPPPSECFEVFFIHFVFNVFVDVFL